MTVNNPNSTNAKHDDERMAFDRNLDSQTSGHNSFLSNPNHQPLSGSGDWLGHGLIF